MASSDDPTPSQPQRSIGLSDVLVSLLTPPVLLSILATRTLTTALQEIGLASEELFRGDRLPSLTIPPPPPEE
ncbi:MAG TPA: hypothetical protein V6D29_14565 [Leptolyngbyaceae cyanobacterium]